MNENLSDQVLAAFKLTSMQKDAALARGCDVAVTAGAGSGKTSTLVARYATLLAEGTTLRRVVAITFSDKASREMRSRVRKTLNKLVASAEKLEERQFWVGLNAGMDSARISTIHSLCAEIIRAHPAEAVVDPRFEVLDEGLTAALRIQIVDDTMATLVKIPEFEPLFRIFDIKDLKNLLAYLLDKRLEAKEAFVSPIDITTVISRGMESLLQTPDIGERIIELRNMKWEFLFNDAGDKLAIQVEELLSLWSEAEAALAMGDILACSRYLFQARREKMGIRVGNRGSSAKEIVKELQSSYDELINPICGGKYPKDTPPNAETESEFLVALKLTKMAFTLMTDSYNEHMQQLSVLDFDDLEYGAAQLLKIPEIQEKWQSQIDSLLVDEFQDTNQRQRAIVEALAGTAGRLFVVGDAKQSIYRFRRADVTVFRAMRKNIKTRGGMHVELNETFRAHGNLLAGMNDLLKRVMGDKEDPSRPYYEPFSPLITHRDTPREGIIAPYIEFVYGAGEEADTARSAAAKALASRLLELKQQRQIQKWDDVTLLFRASTGFPVYENAFEEANIPFVTVAGQGFYDRAEIRDVLNILLAMTDPTDDLAMAGLLRSPAFGMTDTALYQLRWNDKAPAHYWDALHHDLSILSSEDQEYGNRVVAILEDLIPLVDRIPVAELLKKLVDATNYRAILAIEDQSSGSGRLWRNLDKLIGDAQSSGKVNVRDFLDYLTIINDAGAREGEAPAEAQGAVRLMTIHKSKGLQFPIVVLADASRGVRGRHESAYLSQDLGLAFKLDPEPILYRLAKVLEKRQSEAEEQRILYVALTRAQEKLIINGHVTPNDNQGWSPAAWLKKLSFAAQVDVNEIINQAGKEVIRPTFSGYLVRSWAMSMESELAKEDVITENMALIDPDDSPIYAPLVEMSREIVSEDEPAESHYGRVTGSNISIPAKVIGTMVHKAIELWLFPDDPRLIPLLETAAQNAGIVQPAQCITAIQNALSLLTRLQEHPLREEIENAIEVHHEVPYSRMVNGYAETGYLDLLYRTSAGWQIVDFKTDLIHNAEARINLVGIYSGQMRRYSDVVTTMIGQQAHARICFLDDMGKVKLVELD